MPPVEAQGSRDVGKPIERKFGKGGRIGQSLPELPAEFVLELLERSFDKAHANGGGQLRERHDFVVGSEQPTEVELNQIGERNHLVERDDAGDFIVEPLDVNVRLV